MLETHSSLLLLKLQLYSYFRFNQLKHFYLVKEHLASKTRIKLSTLIYSKKLFTAKSDNLILNSGEQHVVR